MRTAKEPGYKTTNTKKEFEVLNCKGERDLYAHHRGTVRSRFKHASKAEADEPATCRGIGQSKPLRAHANPRSPSKTGYLPRNTSVNFSGEHSYGIRQGLLSALAFLGEVMSSASAGSPLTAELLTTDDLLLREFARMRCVDDRV